MNTEDRKTTEREEDKRCETKTPPPSETARTETSAEVHREAFARFLGEYETFYLLLVIICGICAAAAVVTAVLASVPGGVVIAILTALIYRFLSVDEMIKKLGLSYRRVGDGLALCPATGRVRRAELWIPRRLQWLDVTELERGKGDGEPLSAVHLPDTLCRIGEGAIEVGENPPTLYFAGTEAQWEAVEKPESLSVCPVVFGACYPTPPRRTEKAKKRAPSPGKTEETEGEKGELPFEEI